MADVNLQLKNARLEFDSHWTKLLRLYGPEKLKEVIDLYCPDDQLPKGNISMALKVQEKMNKNCEILVKRAEKKMLLEETKKIVTS